MQTASRTHRLFRTAMLFVLEVSLRCSNCIRNVPFPETMQKQSCISLNLKTSNQRINNPLNYPHSQQKPFIRLHPVPFRVQNGHSVFSPERSSREDFLSVVSESCLYNVGFLIHNLSAKLNASGSSSCQPVCHSTEQTDPESTFELTCWKQKQGELQCCQSTLTKNRLMSQTSLSERQNQDAVEPLRFWRHLLPLIHLQSAKCGWFFPRHVKKHNVRGLLGFRTQCKETHTLTP